MRHVPLLWDRDAVLPNINGVAVSEVPDVSLDPPYGNGSLDPVYGNVREANDNTDTYGQEQEHSQAAFFREQPDHGYRLERTIDLPNPIAPVQVFVSNNGDVVTLDNWHNEGYGAVLILYQWDGKTVRSYKLADLFSNKEIESFPMSMSSIWWHKGPTYIQQDQKSFYMGYQEPPDYRELILSLSNGLVRLCATKPKYRCWTPANAHATK